MGHTLQSANGPSERTEQAIADQAHSGNGSAEKGLKLSRFFSTEGTHPFDQLQWDLRTASITNERGEIIFEQKDVEVPQSWSMTATNVVVSKYFHGQVGTPQRETSVRQLVHRVARTIADWGSEGGYFHSDEDTEIFYHELCYLLVNQHFSFNSPVWFNCGLKRNPNAPPVSSTPSKIRWNPFLSWRARKGACSSGDPVRVRIFRRSVHPKKNFPGAVPHRDRSRS
jgi:hypothetical protein